MSNRSNNIYNTTESKSLLKGIKKSLKYMFQSSRGKYNLNTYLEVLGKFTDEEIIASKKENLIYIGGEVSFITDKNKNNIEINVELYFKDINNEWKLKKVQRNLEKTIFTTQTIEELEKINVIKFEVEQPEGE